MKKLYLLFKIALPTILYQWASKGQRNCGIKESAGEHHLHHTVQIILILYMHSATHGWENPRALRTGTAIERHARETTEQSMGTKVTGKTRVGGAAPAAAIDEEGDT